MERTSAPAGVEDTSRITDNAIAVAAIAILILSYCVNAMDRTLFPLILTDVRKEYGFTLPQAGLMSTVFTIGMTVAGIPTGYLLARYTRKTVIQVGILIYSAMTIITVFATGFPDMLFYRAITGVGEAMQLTALLALFLQLLLALPRRRRRHPQLCLCRGRLHRTLARKQAPGRLRHVARADAHLWPPRACHDGVDRGRGASEPERDQ